MYQVLVDKELFCDSRVDDLVIINPVVNLEINKAGTFSFTMPKNHPYIDRIGNRKSMIEVYRDEEKEPLFEGICTCISNDFYGQRTIECEGSLSFFNDTIQRPAHWNGKTVRGLLEAYIARHNSNSFPEHQFEVGTVTVKDSNDYITCYTNYETTMTALKEDLVDDLGGFFRIRHENGKRYIDYLENSPNTNSQVIKIGENLLDLNTTLDSREIVTSVIPLGAKLEQSSIEGLDSRLTIATVNNGTDYLINESTIDTFGIVERVVIWDDVTDAAILKRKGQKYLSDTQFEDLVINAKVVDLHLDEESVESLKLFDNIRAVSKVHGLDRFFMLTKMKIHLNNPENDEITLGTNRKATLSSRIASNNAQTNKRFDEIKTSSMLEQAKENASSLIKTAQNGYVAFVTDNDGHPKELLIMDTNDINTARKVWRWNVNGLGYSSTGYNGRFDTAITMDGSIVADFVKAGTIDGITMNGITINGSEIISEGTVIFDHVNYSQEDVERVNQIIYGTISPTISDIAKYDINGDGVINILDMILVHKLSTGADYVYDVKFKINPSSENNVVSIETDGTPTVVIGRKGISAEDVSCDTISLKSEKGRIRVFYNGIERYGVSGTFVDRDGRTVKVAQGVIVEIGGADGSVG